MLGYNERRENSRRWVIKVGWLGGIKFRLVYFWVKGGVISNYIRIKKWNGIVWVKFGYLVIL